MWHKMCSYLSYNRITLATHNLCCYFGVVIWPCCCTILHACVHSSTEERPSAEYLEFKPINQINQHIAS